MANETQKIFLIDIDGTICDDIPNETPELFATAEHFPDALEILNDWRSQGHQIHFFTARREEHREVTEAWLQEHGFKWDSLLMNKPRIQDGQEYVWVDNRKIRGITFRGQFTNLIEKPSKILGFDDEKDS